jgi:transaldolase
MSRSLLQQLREMTVVVADSGDVESIFRFKPQDSTTNPSLIAAAAKMPQYQALIDGVLHEAKDSLGAQSTDKEVAALAFKRLAVAFGRRILDVVPGRVSTEVDARLSFDREATIAQARDIIQQYDDAGVARNRVLVKIASTWQGIQAARTLEEEGIHCNLTLLFGLHQAVACADAKVTLISPFVGRILDWYKQHTGLAYEGADDPGVQSVTTIYNYLKKFDYATVVMGASFRNIGEIVALAGCDLLTISPPLLAELDSTSADLARRLSPEQAKSTDLQRVAMDEDTFEAMHQENAMAHEQLTQGIQGFTKALESLEKLLADRLTQLGRNNVPRAAAS